MRTSVQAGVLAVVAVSMVGSVIAWLVLKQDRSSVHTALRDLRTAEVGYGLGVEPDPSAGPPAVPAVHRVEGFSAAEIVSKWRQGITSVSCEFGHATNHPWTVTSVGIVFLDTEREGAYIVANGVLSTQEHRGRYVGPDFCSGTLADGTPLWLENDTHNPAGDSHGFSQGFSPELESISLLRPTVADVVVHVRLRSSDMCTKLGNNEKVYVLGLENGMVVARPAEVLGRLSAKDLWRVALSKSEPAVPVPVAVISATENCYVGLPSSDGTYSMSPRSLGYRPE